MKYTSYILGFLFFMAMHIAQVKAQQGVQLSYNPKISLSQWQQPAYLSQAIFKKMSLGLGGAFELGGNQLPIKNWPINESFLDEEEKAAILAGLADDNRFHVFAQGDFLLNLKINKRPYSLGFRQRSLSYVQFHNPNTLGLLLNGNASYAGEAVEDERVLLKVQAYSELSLGTAATKGNFSYGGRIKLLFGNGYASFDAENFSLFTTEQGGRVDMQADYMYENSFSNSGIDGFGLAADLGVAYQVNEKLQVQASALDLALFPGL